MAEFSQANYILNDKKKSKADRIGEVNESIPEGYVVHPSSGRDIALFTNEDKGHAVISHRGTNLGQSKDLTADLLFAGGLENHSTEFKKRTKKTENMLRHIPKDYSLTLQGHSYGGASALNAAVKSHKVRHRVDAIDLYNPLTAGDHDSQKIHTRKNESDKEAADLLNDITTTHRTKNDLVSNKKTAYGKIKHHKQKSNVKKSIPKPFRNIFNHIDQLGAHGLHNFTK